MKQKFTKILALLAVPAILLPTAVSAFYIGSGEQVTLEAAINEDAYIAGQTVLIDKDINGDLFIGAGEVNVASNVSQDLHVAAGDAMISGKIGDDLRLVAGTVVIDGTVTGDVFIAASEVTFGPESVIEGNVTVAASSLVIWGDINGDLLSYADKLSIAGKISGSVKTQNVNLNLADGAVIEGNLDYSSTKEMEINPEQVRGSINFTELKSRNQSRNNFKKAEPFFDISSALFSLVASLLLGIAMLLLTPKMFSAVSEKTKSNLLMSAGIGLAFVGGIMILIPLSFLTIFGYKIGFLLMLKLATWFIVIKIIASYFIGHLYFIKSKVPRNFGWQLLILACGLATWELLEILPGILEVLVKFAVAVLATGGLFRYGKEVREVLRGKKLV